MIRSMTTHMRNMRNRFSCSPNIVQMATSGETSSLSEKPKRQRLEGLSYKLRFPGAVVEDHRGDNPRFVGLIVPRNTGPGYTFCPFVLEKIVFDTDPPQSLRAPKRAAIWMIDHAVGWNDQYDYHHLKYLGWLILIYRKWERVLIDQRMKINLCHLLLSIIIPSIYIPLIPHIATYIISAAISLPFFVSSVRGIFKVIKDYSYKESI